MSRTLSCTTAIVFRALKQLDIQHELKTIKVSESDRNHLQIGQNTSSTILFQVHARRAPFTCCLYCRRPPFVAT